MIYSVVLGYITQQQANVIYGLAKMGASFSELPPALQRDIERSVVKVAHAVTEQEASNIIYS